MPKPLVSKTIKLEVDIHDVRWHACTHGLCTQHMDAVSSHGTRVHVHSHVHVYTPRVMQPKCTPKSMLLTFKITKAHTWECTRTAVRARYRTSIWAWWWSTSLDYHETEQKCKEITLRISQFIIWYSSPIRSFFFFLGVWLETFLDTPDHIFSIDTIFYWSSAQSIFQFIVVPL